MRLNSRFFGALLLCAGSGILLAGCDTASITGAVGDLAGVDYFDSGLATDATGGGASESLSDGGTLAPGVDGTSSGGPGEGGGGSGAQTGLLTAGTFDDNLNLDVFRKFIGDLQQQAGGGIPSLNLGQRAMITVKNEAGNPVGGAIVTIAAAQANAKTDPLLTVPTGTDGRALFATGVDAAGSDADHFTLSVTPPGGGDAVTLDTDLTNLDWQITLPGQQPTTPPAQMDLAFVVDCTGSMGDELEYLKAEISEIAGTVADRFPAVTIRFGLVCYRDEGDEYVTRTFDFTTSLQDFQTNLSLQSADGGGDYPEAVHKALDVAGGLSWTSGPVARVLFWVADAPPHAQFAQTAFEKILTLRGEGVRIYPVGASGVAQEAEFIMRAAAMLTGAEYIFLTDDSGVGNPHAEPHIPCYLVQHLNQVFIRLITSELTGQRQYPAQDQILRTVGNPVNGVCAATQPADNQQQ